MFEKTFQVEVLTDDYRKYCMTIRATVLEYGELELKRLVDLGREVELDADEEYACGFVYRDQDVIDAIDAGFERARRQAREYREQVAGDYASAMGMKL